MFATQAKSMLRGQLAVPTLTAILLLFTILGVLAPSFAINVFALAPGSTIMYHFYVWNIVTGGLLEPNLIRFVISVGIILKLGISVESLWDVKRCGKYIGVTHIATGVTCFVLSTVRAMLTASSDKSTRHLFSNQYGCGGLVAAMCIAYCLEWPHTTIPVKVGDWATKGIRSAHVFSAALAFIVLVHTVGIVVFHDFQLILVQTCIAWTYLRFFEKHPGGYAGNDDEHFAFAAFFPSKLQRFIAPVSSIALRVFNCYGCLSNKDSPRSYKQVQSHDAVRSQRDDVAERRRLRALKELDQKLAALSVSPNLNFGTRVSDIDSDDSDGVDEFTSPQSIAIAVAPEEATNAESSVVSGSGDGDDMDDFDENGGGDDSFTQSQRAVAAVLAEMEAGMEDVGSLASESEDTMNDV